MRDEQPIIYRDAVPRSFQLRIEIYDFLQLVRAKFFDVVKFHELIILPREVRKLVAVIGRQRIVVEDVDGD